MIRRRNFARTLTAAFLLAVAAALLLLSSAPGHAQTTNIYVSNIDQGNDSDWSDSVSRAQSFTTGSQSGGYTVTSVDIGYDDAEGDKFSAAIWTVDSDNEPDDGDNNNKVADLTAPTGTWSAGDTLTFTAPAGTTLDAGTTYAVVLTATGNAVRLDSTTSDDEDSGAFAGWSIADTGYFISSNTWTANPTGKALRIAIKGTTTAAAVDFSNLAAGHTSPVGMWSPDGSTLWVGQWLETRVYAYNLADETLDSGKSWTLHNPSTAGDRNRKPTGIWSNANRIYVTDPDHGRVFQYQCEAVSWDATMSGVASQTLSSTIFEGYFDSAHGSISTSEGTLDPASFTVDGVEYQVQKLAFATNGNRALNLWTNPAVTKNTPANIRLRITIGGTTKDLGTPTASHGTNGVTWQLSQHGYTGGDWDNTDVKVELLRRVSPDSAACNKKTLTSANYTLHADNGNRQGLWSDGTTAWVADAADDNLYAYALSDFSRDSGKDIDLASGNTAARGIWSDGTTIWVLDKDDEKLYAYALADGSRKADLDITLDSAGENYNSIWSDGTTMYVIENTNGSATRDPQIHQLPLPAANNPATGAPTITGTAQVGQMLTAATSGIMDADGLATPGYTYQWIRVDGGTEADISGATASTYTLVAADLGKTIKVKVSFTDDASNAETLTSAATATVAAAAVDDCGGDWTSTCSVSPGSSVTGDVESSGDKDSFRLSVTSGVTYRIDAEGAPTSMGTLANPYLELRDSSWLQLTENDDGGAGLNAHVTWTAPFTGNVFVVIRPPNSMDTGTYTLTVSVSNNLASGPLVSIAVEGDAEIIDQFIAGIGVPKVKFRVSIPAALTANLDVTINISEVSDTRTDLGNAQTADYVAAADEGNQTVTIAAGDTSAVHEVEVQRDETFEQDGDVRAEVAPGFGYRASASARSAAVRVLDVNQPYHIRALHSDGSPLTGGAKLAHIRVDESAGKVTLLAECVTLYDREPRLRANLKISMTSQKITAEYRNREDYRSFAEQMRCTDPDDPALGASGGSGGGGPWSTTGFRRVQRADGSWVYQSVVTLVGYITEDQVYDPDETFRVKLQRGPNLLNYVTLVTTSVPGVSQSSLSSHLVTILDDARAPANLEATVEGVVVGLTWDELPGPRPVETYEVKVNDGPWRALDTGPSTHGVVGGLTPGVENTITVGARYWGPERPRFGRGDCEVYNCSVKVMGPILDTVHADGPDWVTGLTVSRMAFGEAELTWTPPSDTGAYGIGGYQWRATGGSFDVEPELLNRWHDIAPSVMETNGNTTSAIINWLEGVDHTIHVRAWSGLRKYPGGVASIALPGTGANQPTNLRATARADTWMTLSWTAPSTRPGTIDEYHVETRDPFTDNQWSFGGEGTGGTGTTYTVRGLEPGVEYTFRVRGRSDSLGLFTPSDYFTESTRSAGSPAQALAQVVYPPGATSLFAYANGGSRIDLGWITTNPASTRYDLEWSADGATGWQAVDPPDDGGDTTYGHTGLTADTTYYYRVRGVNGDGPGPWALASATTSAPAPKEAQAANNPATGAPAITGTAQVGETLTADTAGIADADGLAKAAFSYQWQADGADISGATDSTYTLADADEGKAVSVKVSFTDDAGNAESLTSAATDAVAAKPNSPATGAPAISGTAQVGETLTADTSGVADGDGLTNASFAYQWLADGTDISEATDSTYTLADSDEGTAISVTVSFTDDGGNEESLTSAATDAVEPGTEEAQAANSPATGAPTISGTAQVGETLTADTSGIADDDGLTNASFGYQWLADGTDISSATSETYTLANLDEGKAVSVKVTFTDDGGNEESLTSAATDAVEARPNSPATGQPAITGTAQVGETLTADTSEIADADGLDNAAFSYQWISNSGSADSEIGGATGSTYILASDDVGRTIKVRVSFTDDRGHQETLTSAATAVVEAASLPPLTASLENVATSHDGESVFTFELRFSEEFGISYKSLRDHAFTVTGGAVRKAQRLEQGSNARWEITVQPDGNGDVTVVLPATDDCAAQGAICAEDGRMLSNRLELAVAGPVTEEEQQQDEPEPENSPATGQPTITGAVQVGETLTAVTSDIEDDDGLTNASFSYQWLAGNADISGATGSTYTLADADEGKAIQVRVSFADDAGNEESLTSAATAAVEPAPAPPPAPANLTAVVENGNIVLNWSVPSDESVTSYQVLRRRPHEGEETLLVYVENTGSTATTFTDTNVKAGTQHVYRVKAINSAGVGRQSNFARATP